ncbi:hypothetical protein [Lysobacter capsici]|uniref:hypothetical protein n=1 Tax=Lysobacter capsici TaxID=435897 RepID=UPI000BBB4506|nr:hypothetical protein [Lysobacter capsici]ATE71439.1 hypothetical protein CNO08_08795 [Lysobacter capsici]
MAQYAAARGERAVAEWCEAWRSGVGLAGVVGYCMGWVLRARERGLGLNKHLVEMEEVFAGKAGLLFFKVDMIFEGRDAMLFPPFGKGG